MTEKETVSITVGEILDFRDGGNAHRRLVIIRNEVKLFCRIPNVNYNKIFEDGIWIQEVVFIRNGEVTLKDGTLCPAFKYHEVIYSELFHILKIK